MKDTKSLKLLSALAFATLVVYCRAHAGSHTWSGANDTYFNNAGNWSFGGAPTAAEQDVYLYFPAGATHYTCSNNITGLTIKGIGFSGDNYSIIGKPITLATASITDSGSFNILNLPMTLVSNTTVNVSSGKGLTLSGVLSGAGGLTMTGTGTVQFNNLTKNSYTGTTYVNSGQLNLACAVGGDGGVTGPLVIGTGAGSQGTAIVKLFGNNQIADVAPVTINFTGVLDANDNIDWIGGLNIAGGEITTGAGEIRLLGDVNVQVGTAYIYGNFALYGTNRVFNAVPGGTLNIYANLNGYLNSPGFIKLGAGAVNLVGTNTFEGPVLVSQGYLSLYSHRALGLSSGLTVTNLGIVQMMGVGITNVPAKLSGNGNGNGALRAFGTNVWDATITLTGNAGIQPLGASDLLKITGSINGTGNLTKLGAGSLVFAGISANSYNGTTTVSQGTLQLSKSNTVAIPHTLVIGDATNAPFSRVVKIMSAEQIDNMADVIVNSSGLLDFTSPAGVAETLGSLAGAGNVNLGFNDLFAGTNGGDTTFTGSFSGLPNSSSFEKQGSGTMFINGDSPGFSGTTTVSGGTLSLNGSFPASPVRVTSGAMLLGNAITGPLAGYAGKVAPGNSAGSIYCENFVLQQSSTLEIELTGLAAGVEYDQINVSGSVNLGNASLHVILGFPSSVGNKFVIIQNDGNEAVTNTFNGLPEGATFYASGAQFQITYKGGDGNDVVLTQTALPGPSHIGNITHLGNGQTQIAGTGNVGMIYGIEANSDLGTTNWVNIGMAQANQLGEISFTDTNAPNYSMRFYRFKAK